MEKGVAHFLKRISFPLIFVGVIWVIHLIQEFGGIDLRTLGVFPQHLRGLPGIFTSPLIHGSWGHLFFNSLSFVMIGTVLFWFYPRIAFKSVLWLYVLSGVGIWIFGQPNSFHIGASGVIYGMVSLVFWNGVFRRNVKSIILALIILMMYSGLFEGIIPGKEGISWEGHLSGAVAGIILAWFFRKEIEVDEIKPPELEDNEEKTYFLPRDTFEITLAQRRALWEQQQNQLKR